MKWEDDEIRYLIKNFSDTSNKELAKALNRNLNSIKSKGISLKLLKSDEHIKKTRFQKGNIPYNVGLKMTDYLTEDAIKSIKRTQFKKGSTPHNALPINAEVTRVKGKPYIMIKVKDKQRLAYKHRYLWELENGKIKKGFNIIFKNNNTLDCRLENLECVSNEELMKRNTIHQYPLYLKTTILKLNKLKKKLCQK